MSAEQLDIQYLSAPLRLRPSGQRWNASSDIGMAEQSVKRTLLLSEDERFALNGRVGCVVCHDLDGYDGYRDGGKPRIFRVCRSYSEGSRYIVVSG